MQRCWAGMVSVVVLLSPALSAADIYRCTGADGSVRFSDQPCDSNSKAVTRASAVLEGDARCERAGQIAYDTAQKYSRGVGKVKILAELGSEANDPLYKRAVDIGYQYGLGAENLRKQALRECRNELLRTVPATVSAPDNARDFTINGQRYRLTRLLPWQEMDSNIRTDDVSLTFQSPPPVMLPAGPRTPRAIARAARCRRNGKSGRPQPERFGLLAPSGRLLKRSGRPVTAMSALTVCSARACVATSLWSRNTVAAMRPAMPTAWCAR